MMRPEAMRCVLVSLVALLPIVGSANVNAAEPDPRWMQQAHKPGITPLQKQAYEQIAELRNCGSAPMVIPGGFDILTIQSENKTPGVTLSNMGFDVLPALVEALDDTTPSGLVEPDGRGRESKTWKVNELAARLIVRIAHHDFVMGNHPDEHSLCTCSWQCPELLPKFQQQVLEWYSRNRERTLEDRIIADVRDDYFSNRLDAVEWLGKHKVLKGQPAIVQYIHRILAVKDKDSLDEGEMAECALALGKIGDKGSLPVVRQICRYLADALKEGHGVSFDDLHRLFQSHQGRALLGEKAETLRDLQILFGQYEARMEPSTCKYYQERLQDAAKW